MSSDTLRLEAYLNDRYRTLARPRPPGIEAYEGRLKILPPLDPMEARDFLAGYDAGLFTIDDLGYAQSRLLPTAPGGNDRQKLFQLFWHGGKTGRFLFREGVCQLAAASALVLDYGWPEEQVRLEPNKGDLGELAYGVDLIVSDPAGRAVIIGEVKRDRNSLRTLICDVIECGRMGPHSAAECGRSQHPKFAVCWSRRDDKAYFWAVCPGGRHAFSIECTSNSLELVEVDDLPRPSF